MQNSTLSSSIIILSGYNPVEHWHGDRGSSLIKIQGLRQCYYNGPMQNEQSSKQPTHDSVILSKNDPNEKINIEFC